MDPYRPNNYGFRPPPQGGGYSPQQRFPPQVPGMRPPYGGPPPQQQQQQYMGRPPPLSGPPPISPTTNTDTNNEKLTTLFVGAIAPGVGDGWIEKLLETCGKLTHWKRTKDAAGKPKGFGFATYADPESVLCALRVLGGEKTNGVTLRAMDGSGVEKKLIVKADDTVRNYLESYTQSNDQGNTTSDDQEKYATVEKYMHSIATGQQHDANDEDAISKELAFFKERAAQKDQRRFDESPTRRSSSKRDFLKGPTEYSSYSQQQQHQDTITDEEIEQKRKEKHERDVENAYRQREKRFENRQANKLRDYEKDLKRERDEEERELKDKEYWLERLSNWDDDIEAEKGEELYYADKSRWRKLRESIRRREHERDEEDRRREAHEMEEEKIRLEEEERQKKDSKFLNREADDGKIAIKPKKLNFNLPIKRNTLGGGDEDDEEEAKKRRVLVPLDYGDIENVKTSYDDDEEEGYGNTQELSEEERAKKVKELITSIPSSQTDLWSYSVKWDVMDESLIEEKLHPFVSKKIVELLGMEEDDLVSFVLDFIRKRKGPDELVSELEGALDEDALVFVMKLWRALIFETERKYKKL